MRSFPIEGRLAASEARWQPHPSRAGHRYGAGMTERWQTVWDAPRPFVHPLLAPDGATLTVDAPPDHPWHHALWFTIKFVDGDNFWEEYGDFGLLQARVTEATPAHQVAAIDWVRPDGTTVALREERRIEHVPIDDSAYALDWTMVLRSEHDAVLDRTPFTTWGGYGGLTLRGAPDWTDTTLRLASDDTDRDRVLGDRAAWCDLTGTTALGNPAGVTIIDHPANDRHPTPWYASTRADTYGEGWANFLNAAFLWDAPLVLAADAPMTRRHRVLVHDGRWDRARIHAHADEFAAT